MKKIDKRLKISIGIAIASAVVIGVLGVGARVKPRQEAGKVRSAEQAETEAPIEGKATLIVDDGTGSPQEIETEFGEGDTVFDLLKQAGVDIEYTESNIGIFIDAIGGIFNDEKENKYWMYYVNSEMVKKGVGEQSVEPGDKIEFRYGKVSW